MKGHLAKKGNRYYAVIYEGVDPATGKERHCWHAAGETRRGAERVLTELVKRVHDGAYRPPDRISLVDYLQKRWLPVKSTRVKSLTAALYERCIRLYIAPHIGRIPLQRLRADDLDGLYATLLTSGKRDGTGLSARSVRLVHAMLHSALHDAVRKGIIDRNVADAADPLATRRVGQNVQVWAREELRRFLTAVADHDLHALFFLAATTGIRRGELAGLRWSDVDLDGARLTVNRQIVGIDGALGVSDLKTPSSRRTVALDEATVSELRRHRRQQREQQLATGARSDGDYVFAQPDGSPPNPHRITDTFIRAAKRLDVPRIRFHDLRHTHATILLQHNVNPKVVSERLGHSNLALTMNIYQHVMPTMQTAAADTFGAAVFDSTPEPTDAPARRV